jgi:ComF family protein
MLKLVLSSTGEFFCVLFNLIYPQNCLICSYKINELTKTPVCGSCRDKVNADRSSVVYGEGVFAFDRAYCATTYDDVSKKCICLLKYEGKTQLVKPLADMISGFAERHIRAGDVDLIVPVPLHPAKLRERQFNQSELLAAHLAKKMGRPLSADAVKRIKYTMPQTGLKREERLKNVKGAFMVKRGCSFSGKRVLLIDDVLTTGTTLNECAKALKAAGADKVTVLALARGN